MDSGFLRSNFCVNLGEQKGAKDDIGCKRTINQILDCLIMLFVFYVTNKLRPFVHGIEYLSSLIMGTALSRLLC